MIGFLPHLKAYTLGLVDMFRENGFRVSWCENLDSENCGSVFFVMVRSKLTGFLHEIELNNTNIKLRLTTKRDKRPRTYATFDYENPDLISQLLDVISTR